MKQTFWRRFRNSQLFWPVVAWVLILLFDAIVEPRFFQLGILDDPVYGKHLYGNLIDIFNNGAPLILVSIGMTLVIATGGVDLSVGAVIVGIQFLSFGFLAEMLAHVSSRPSYIIRETIE